MCTDKLQNLKIKRDKENVINREHENERRGFVCGGTYACNIHYLKYSLSDIKKLKKYPFNIDFNISTLFKVIDLHYFPCDVHVPHIVSRYKFSGKLY